MNDKFVIYDKDQARELIGKEIEEAGIKLAPFREGSDLAEFTSSCPGRYRIQSIRDYYSYPAKDMHIHINHRTEDGYDNSRLLSIDFDELGVSEYVTVMRGGVVIKELADEYGLEVYPPLEKEDE